MNKKEKNAIKCLEVDMLDNKQIEIILNLIEKQQKEIEEREARLQEEINENCKLKTELYGYSISKDKIKAKIKELENKKNCGNSIVFWEISSQVDLLKELLEEE